MEKRNRTEDELLVRECLAGKEEAWKEFYSRFVNLMRSVVRKYSGLSPEDIEDLTQASFLSLTTALSSYDHRQSLPRFVCVITERVLIDEYRRVRAAKRDAELHTSAHADVASATGEDTGKGNELQDISIERAEEVSLVRSCLEELDPRCRELMTLRYFRELSFNEIADLLGETENTVTVQAKRCLAKLRAKCYDLGIRG